VEPLPKEAVIQKRLLRSQEHASRETEYRERRKQKKGFMASARDLVSQAAFQMEKAADAASNRVQDQLREWDYDYTVTFFRQNFPAIAATETVWDQGIHCRVLSSGLPVFGVAIATTNYLCFDGYLSKTQRLQFVVPLRMVQSIQRAVSLPVTNTRLAPVFQTLIPGSSNVRADAVQVYTNDNRVHCFYSFSSNKSFEKFYNIADHAWRANIAGSASILYLNNAARPTNVYPAQPVPLAPQARFPEPAPVVMAPAQPGAAYVPPMVNTSPYVVPGVKETYAPINPISAAPKTY